MHLEVLGHRLHMVTEGAGAVAVVLLHGTPTNAQLWREVVPVVAAKTRVVAPDLLGFGDSDKPADVTYDLPTLAAHVRGVLDALEVKRYLLCAMDLGLLVGLHLAANDGERCVGVAAFEGFFLPMDVTWPLLGWRSKLFRQLLSSDFIAARALAGGAMATTFLKDGVVRPLSEADLERYVGPLRGEGHLRRLWIDGVGPRQLGPRSRAPGDTVDLINQAAAWLERGSFPVRLLTAAPGLVVSPRLVEVAKQRLPRLEVRPVGAGKHFLPEDQPAAIARELLDLHATLG